MTFSERRHDPGSTPKTPPSPRVSPASVPCPLTLRASKPVRAALPAAATSAVLPSRRRWVRPLLAVAASLLIIAAVFAVFLTGNPLQAAADPMIQLHEDIVAGRVKGAIPRLLPTPMPSSPASTPTALRFPVPARRATPRLLLPARPKSKSRLPSSRLQEHSPHHVRRQGRRHHHASWRRDSSRWRHRRRPHEARGYQMVMTRHQDTWICLVAKLPPDDLIALASKENLSSTAPGHRTRQRSGTAARTREQFRSPGRLYSGISGRPTRSA